MNSFASNTSQFIEHRIDDAGLLFDGFQPYCYELRRMLLDLIHVLYVHTSIKLRFLFQLKW